MLSVSPSIQPLTYTQIERHIRKDRRISEQPLKLESTLRCTLHMPVRWTPIRAFQGLGHVYANTYVKHRSRPSRSLSDLSALDKRCVDAVLVNKPMCCAWPLSGALESSGLQLQWTIVWLYEYTRYGQLLFWFGIIGYDLVVQSLWHNATIVNKLVVCT